jgi:hypothetical protein
LAPFSAFPEEGLTMRHVRTENVMGRREFMRNGAAAITAASFAPGLIRLAAAEPQEQPWYRRTLRWAQTNITEIDPAGYDIGWWRQHWKRTRIQGVIINAGGIFAYYPSKYSLHYRPAALGDRDLFGELANAAREDGIVVFARMDSNRTHEDFYRAHPDWFAVDATGEPYRAGELYVTCVNSPYYDEYLPTILREIIDRSHPEGFTDNSWSGLDRNSICFCDNCERKFRARTGQPIPRRKDWDDPTYRQWIRWNYDRRLEIWDLNNRTTREAGGPHCIWAGMNSGSVSSQASRFRDYPEICRRAEIIMLDHQARSNDTGFQENGEAGKLVHGLLGWDKLIPESMAMYQNGQPTYRKASKPEPEARLWMLEGIAGTIQPWWHHVGAYHEDRRQYRTAESVNRWHEANEEYLVNRRPVATVGVVWSQQNTDFYGRDDPADLVDLPFRGVTNAMIRARIPFLPVHVDHIGRDEFAVLVLPNLGAMSQKDCQAVRRFVESGGHLIATGRTSLYDEWGTPCEDFALADLLGVHRVEKERASIRDDAQRAEETLHSYLRLTPELRGTVDGPKIGNEPAVAGQRHPVLNGFEETDILPFGGRLEKVTVAADAQVLLTYIPPFPVYPPETAWMRTPRTDIPGLIVRTTSQGSRIAYLAGDIDRRYARDNLPDHGNLLANLVRWTAGDTIPLAVEGPGLIDCHLYRQQERTILHLVNLTNAGTWRAPVDELIPIGPLNLRVRLPHGLQSEKAKLLVAAKETPCVTRNGWTSLALTSLVDHEVLVFA